LVNRDGARGKRLGVSVPVVLYPASHEGDMMRRFVLALAIGVMAAGSVREGSIDVDFNPNAEFEKYKTWAWIPDRDKGHHGVLADLTMRERVEKALALRLGEAGL